MTDPQWHETWPLGKSLDEIRKGAIDEIAELLKVEEARND